MKCRQYHSRKCPLKYDDFRYLELKELLLHFSRTLCALLMLCHWRRNMRTRRQPVTVNLPATSSDAGSGDAASQDASHSTEEATVSASGREQCSHYKHDTAHLDKVLLEILSSEHVASCEHCREDAPRKKGSARSKERGGKQQKKKGGGARGTAAKVQAKAKNSDMWVCLHCGRHFCGGAVADTKPYGHARRHAKQDRHWWAAKYDDPTVAYCLSCEKEVLIEMPKLETVVAVKTDDKMVGAVDSDALPLVNCHGNVIKGLPNLGNTCFLNAVVQNLLALDSLRRKMLGPDVPTGPLAMSLKKLFVETSASNDAGGALSSKNLFSNICSKYPQFRGYQMQDSHELLRCFLDGLRTEEIEARKLAEDDSNEGVPTIVDSIFGGQLSSTVSSTECSHSSVKHDQFLDLSLPVPSRRPPAKSVSSPPAKRTKQSIRDWNKNRRYGTIPARVSPTVEENNKEKIQTVAECNDSQIPGSESGQVVNEKEPEPSECSESCASVSIQELKVTSNVEDNMSWLDYVADAGEAKSEILDSADSAEAGHIWGSKDDIHGSFHPQDDALPREQILGSEHSGENTLDHATSLQPVILLPYKDTAKELDETEENSQNSGHAAPPPAASPVEENDTQPPSGGDIRQDDYVGLGDMFNEPEVTSEVKKGTGKSEDIDVMAWSSNSADDEVDDSNAPISVEGCLALYTEPELLSEPWHCEHCTNAARPNIDERKSIVEMMGSANERKEDEEMMPGGDKEQHGVKLVMSCNKKDIDQIMTTDGCSDNVHSEMHCMEGEYANPSLAEPEQIFNDNFSDTGNTTVQKTGVDKTEQLNSSIYHQEQCKDLNSSAVECTSLSKQSHDLAIQQNDGCNVDITTEATSAPLSCGDNDSVSCTATNNIKAECGGGAEEVVASSPPSDAQRILPSAKDIEDVNTRNQGRRKQMKMVGKGNQVKDNQNKQKEDEAKVFRAAMRRILISKAPPALTINLNRFSQDSHGRFKKLKGHVRFKEMLDIRPFMDPRSKENDNTTYHLVGVVEHMGSMTGGHYIAYVRAGRIRGRQQQSSSSKSWFYASDGQVREASLQEVLNCEAYLLLYERVGD
ncbi:ubiquitin carboxyl-terminal hydrolase 2-like isoform X2 [Phragmites australis]|uniref:ubiquitin carboxyl-terminal hydrolase 2-like isoform X2 n=1 Tax=Phragmites australis TaxID=29695 RepID=UPI002D792F04|nr:ubiquitin carboxyl-terminal hydrolase 2-like isoform X2 [Phragmites australis]